MSIPAPHLHLHPVRWVQAPCIAVEEQIINDLGFQAASPEARDEPFGVKGIG